LLIPGLSPAHPAKARRPFPTVARASAAPPPQTTKADGSGTAISAVSVVIPYQDTGYPDPGSPLAMRGREDGTCSATRSNGSGASLDNRENGDIVAITVDRSFPVSVPLIFRKGRDSHDYKYGAAIWEECVLASDPKWRAPLTAAALFNLPGARTPDSPLMDRARAAVKTVLG
jgi:hypothetical protein